MNAATQDDKGNYLPAKSLEMTCEHNGCESTIGKDYIRNEIEPGWENEPIFLCDKHAKGFQPFITSFKN